MRGQSPLVRAARTARLTCRSSTTPLFTNNNNVFFVCRQCQHLSLASRPRGIQISAKPTTDSRPTPDIFDALPGSTRDPADARFEVIGAPSSLLSVTLSASQRLYTRRGTLVSVTGRVENAQSTLSLLSPLPRALLGVPFLYQRISSTTPITALIGTSSPNTSFSVLHLDGTTDYMVAQRNALLAWTGHTLRLSPRIQQGLAPANWGATHVTGRGLVALASPGQIYELTLAEGEELTLHPSHVVAYSVTRKPPLPFRFRSTRLNLQLPAIPESVSHAAGRLVPAKVSEFLANMRDTKLYTTLARILHSLRTATRRTIWGDRLFLQFRGPTNILMSSRGVRVSDVLTRDDINEIADTEAGLVGKALGTGRIEKAKALEEKKKELKPLVAETAGGGDKPAFAPVEAPFSSFSANSASADFADEAKTPADKVIEEVAAADKEDEVVKKQQEEGETTKPVKMRIASVGKDGKVTFEESKDLNQFVR
ncbi:mitochondrial biogenesis AIM24-domain-containing protein [Pseudoneurospora amorphoporcata]|uniref:Altered inheritance of mitochondria protein 24, mitochondrial n=1 Tax=Pseudoneurospora amorphoporcata TaxID=241081 RepID=A0AAN6NXF8_9PEZI|nr:mitochondrial biogenesis AIM24-domain-containing protein [Pseudoneurospora amorphoporcata]